MVARTDFRFTSADGLRVACARWDGRGPMRGIVQIAHGMFYPGGRHEMLNEINRGDVLARLIAWIGATLDARSHPSRSLSCRQTASSPD